MQPFFDTLRFSDGQGLQKTLPTPSGLSGEGGVRGFETEGGRPALVGWCSPTCNPAPGAWGRRFSQPAQLQFNVTSSHLNHYFQFDPSSLPTSFTTLDAVWQSGSLARACSSRRSPALQNLHSSLDFCILSGISVPKQASRGAR